jgi:hypothetical protein
MVRDKGFRRTCQTRKTGASQQNYECQLCNKFFDNEEKFQKHIIQVHSEKNQSNDFNSNLPTTK